MRPYYHILRAIILSMLLSVAAWGQPPDKIPTQTLAHVPTAVSRLDLNDNGWGVWTTGRGSDSQVFVWDGEKVRPLGFAGRNNRDGRINLNNWVVWSADRTDGSGNTDIYLWKGGGEPVCLSTKYQTAAEPHLNNRGDIVWWGCEGGKNEGIADIFLLKSGAKSPINITVSDREGASRNPRINDAGIVSYERSHEKKKRVVTDLVTVNLSKPKKRVQITDSNDLNVTNGGINRSGELVWEQWTDNASNWHVYKYTPKGRPVRLTDWRQADRMPCIVDTGDIAWHTDYYGGSLPYRLKNDKLEQIPVKYAGRLTRPVAINSRGQVLYASGDGSETGFDILLATPDNERKLCGMFGLAILFWLIVVPVVLISKWRSGSWKSPPLMPH